MPKMTINELRIQAALTSLQAIIEAKGGFVGEFFPETAVKESFRIADKFVEHYTTHYKDA